MSSHDLDHAGILREIVAQVVTLGPKAAEHVHAVRRNRPDQRPDTK